jgi:Putative peptidoglycan binding domain
VALVGGRRPVVPVPRPAFPGVSSRLVETSGWRRLASLLALIAAIALVAGIVLGTGSSKGASRKAKSSGQTTVERRDLVQTDTESGTLGYATPRTVYNRVSGTITWLPAIGQVIKPGGTLYKVDNAPVVLFNGDIPAYRSLTEGVSDGPDVQELKQALVALGFDPTRQITINQTFDAATASAVDRWQASLGETQTGAVTLGQIVFLPGSQRITSVNTVLGSSGSSSASGGSSSGSSGSDGSSSGSSGSGGSSSGSSGSGGSSGSSGSGGSSSGSSGSGSSTSGTSTTASTPVAPSHAQFVSLTTTQTTTTSSATPGTSSCPTSSATKTDQLSASRACPQNTGSGTSSSRSSSSGNPSATTLSALLALLKAETAELKKSSGAQGAGSSSGSGRSAAAASSGAGRSGGGGSSAAIGSGSSGGAGVSASSASSGGTAQPILQTTSTQEVVTVDLDATKQTEAVVGEPVTVELPDGSTVDGKITEVSPVAQNSSSSSSSASGGAGGSGSSTPSATVPVTITLTGHRAVSGLDQAAVSVNFEQQKATGVLSVPVTALLATAGGGYAVQEAQPPGRLIPVTPGLFAAGYVQISGAGVYSGLQVTDSQG